MYDFGQTQGFFLFAGTVLHRMNASLWNSWGLPGMLDRHYQPWLGAVNVSVLDSATQRPIAGAVARVTYNGASHVTRKTTQNHSGSFVFGGWAGQSEPAPHTIRISAPGYDEGHGQVFVAPGVEQHFTVHLRAVT